jgi:DeoR/GlpR family transcriptional regulator of sugar metabolism
LLSFDLIGSLCWLLPSGVQGATMLAAERREAIRRLVRNQGTVYVSDLSQRFDTSSSTIRRDLEWLATQGKLQRIFGGAVALQVPSRFDQEVDDVARRIGQAAAALILPGETVFIGPGLLCQATAQCMCSRSDLTVITNSLDVAWALFRGSALPLILTGGPVVRPSGALVGQVALRALDAMRADRLVMEVAGIAPLEGLTTDQLPQAEVLRPVLESVAQVTVLVAAERLGRAGAAWLGPVSDADVIITGRDAPSSIAWDLSETGVKVTLV